MARQKPPKAPPKATPKAKPAPTPEVKPELKPGGPELRAEAMRLLAEGHQLSSVARALEIPRTTVRDWRDSPNGQAELDTARKARETLLAEGRDAANRILREAAPKAAQRLVDALAAPPPASTAAAEAILARVGLPRSTKVEATVEPALDLGALTDEELGQLEALHAKARR